MEGRPLDETELIRRTKGGDVAAYEQLVRIHQRTALRVAGLVLRDHAEAEDAVQEAFVKAHRHLHRFRDGAPFRPWLLRIVRNEALNRRRGAGRRQRLALRMSSEPASDGTVPSPETAFVEVEGWRRLLAAVEALPPRYRDVVHCRFFADLSEAETAQVLGVAAGTVKSRTFRALEQLRRSLVVEGGVREVGRG